MKPDSHKIQGDTGAKKNAAPRYETPRLVRRGKLMPIIADTTASAPPPPILGGA